MQRPFSKLVVAGASRGGFRALRELFAHLPSDFPAPILVACHISPEQSHAPGQPVVQGLPFRWAEDGDALVAGQILFAPPDRHLVVTDGRIRLSAGPKENLAGRLSIRCFAPLRFSTAETSSAFSSQVIWTMARSDFRSSRVMVALQLSRTPNRRRRQACRKAQ
jgi:hypothetical protein